MKKLRAVVLFLLMVTITQSTLFVWHSANSGHISWSFYQSNTLSYMLISGTNWEARGQFDYEDADMYSAWPEEQRLSRSIETVWQRISERPYLFPFL